jgi:hypothetical protein
MNRSDLERARTLSPITDLTLEDLARRRERKEARRRMSTLVVLAVIASLAIGAVFAAHEGTGSPAPSAATDPSVINPVDPAAGVARSFLDAFGRFDAERAMTYVADDADVTGMEGYPEAGSESLSMLTSFLEAFGWKQTITSCEAHEAALPTDTTVVCAFDWQGLRSDELDRGPFSDSEFVITVRGSEIVEASWYWNIQKFSVQMWVPFAAWVSKTYPKDVETMYENGQTNFRLSPESIRLWDQHSREYVKEVLATEGK